MIHEQKSVSVARKAGSVALLLGGATVIYACVISIISSLWLPGWPDVTFWIISLVMIAVGGGLIAGGVFLWNRWRLSLGIIHILLSLFTVPAILGLRSDFVQAAGAKAQWFSRMFGAYSALSALLALTGITLLLVEKRRRRQAGSLSSQLEKKR